MSDGPKGYVIVTSSVNDQPAFQSYAAKSGPILAKAGGKAIILEPAPQVIEGQWHGPFTLVVEFESVEAARNWYFSDEYQALVGERLAAADCKGVIVAGL